MNSSVVLRWPLVMSLTAGLFTNIVFADSISFKDQLTKVEYLEDSIPTIHEKKGATRTSYVTIGESSCEKQKLERKKLKDYKVGTPEFEAVLQRSFQYGKQCSVKVYLDDKEENVTGISFTNDGNNSIVQQDKTPEESSRTYSFRFYDRQKQDMMLQVTDDSGLTGKMSHDLLETSIIFIPRKVIPHVEPYEDQGECKQKVILPTSEYIVFDAITKEIIGGVLKESPMDLNLSRHKRKFAQIKYEGNGIMIRADRRYGAPEYTYKSKFNIHERVSEATVTHKGKTCYVAKSLLWTHTNNTDQRPFFKFASDQEFLDVIANPICGWNLSLSDIE